MCSTTYITVFVTVGLLSYIVVCHEMCVHHLCENRCGSPPTNVGVECGCDPACQYFEDCCYDYGSTCPSSQFVEAPYSNILLKCIPGDRKFTSGFYAIGLCRDTSSVYVERCENPRENDILLTIIVSDQDDNIYRNVYCALCNGVSTTNVTAWEVTFYCSGNTCLELKNIDEGFKKEFKLLGTNDTRRACNWKAVGHCKESYSNESVIYACEERNYTAIVYDDDGPRVYKNQNCAICNDMNEYSCEDPSFSEGPELGLTPLTVVVDFSAQSSVRIDSESGSYVTEGVTCATGEVFDPFTSKCIALSCSPGLSLQDSQCVDAHAPFNLTDCTKSDKKIHQQTFCSCSLQEQSVSVDYHYQGVQNATCVDEFTDNLKILQVKYHHKILTQKMNKSVMSISMSANHCDLVYAIYNLVMTGINNTNTTQLNLVTFTHNCSTTKLPENLFCPRENITDEFLDYDDNHTALFPNGGYLLEVVHQFSNESYSCRSLSVSTCQFCPQTSLLASAFIDQGNGTYVYNDSTGKVFQEDEIIFSNTTDTVRVCSFQNQTGEKIVLKINQFFKYDGILSYISVIGTILSLLGLLLTIILRIIFAELRTLSGNILINISISLFGALLLTLIQGNFIRWETLCTVLAVFLLYLWLVCFLWMNTIAFELSRTFLVFRAAPRSKRSKKKSFMYYFIYSWGIPAVYIGVLMSLHHCDCTGLNVIYGDDSICWIRDEVALLYVFGIPLAVILLPNAILFVATICGIRESKQSTAVVSGDKSKQKQLAEELFVYIRISTVMGLSLIFGFLASFFDHVILWYLFVILNSLQGVFIFIAFNITYSTKRILTSQRNKRPSQNTTIKSSSI
ncbi:uncharacterized protein [Antedon mediterranea]|uniref:uncharacterized protein n=1 Tax=Antedon mediterranea TaxID=105859 RepID=UPI003AF4B31C